jgi:Phage integrase family
MPGVTPTARTVRDALRELQAAGLAIQGPASDGAGPRWSACPSPQDNALASLKLRGPHDLRHTFSTWLEDAGIPARVIDELMGHAGGWRGIAEGSAIGIRYRHTTPEMEGRVVAAIQQRLAVALTIADEHPAL